MSPDVKVYQAYVEIDDSVKDLNLKPGLSADCMMFTEAQVVHVLAVPMQAVLNPLEKGGKPRCYVMTATGAERRDVELGLNDKMYYEVRDGLKEGDQIVLNPRVLLDDKDKKAAGTDDKAVSGSSKPQTGRGQGGDPAKGK